MKTVIIIPARYGSTRLRGKPLLAKSGKPLIQHCWEKARAVEDVADIIIATDDQRIFDVVENFGGCAVMTSDEHTSGTERIAEVVTSLDADIIINLQGDEPEIEPELITKLVDCQKKLMQASQAPVKASTIVCPFPNQLVDGPGSPKDPSAVKAVLSNSLQSGYRKALYFSRTNIPYNSSEDEQAEAYLHIGIYGFDRKSLLAYANHQKTPLERSENLEQLRILEMGGEIAALETKAQSPGIDTLEDYKAFLQRVRQK